MPCYVIVDPVGNYASHIKSLLDKMELPALAVFSDKMRMAVWEHKWSHRIGDHVKATFLADDSVEIEKVARKIKKKSPDGFYGIIPWDEMHMLLGARLGELLGIDWNSARVIERCRDKYVMKAWLREHGSARINASRVVTNADEARAFQEEVGSWPIVVKPTEGAGAMNVYFAGSPGELLGGCQRVLDSGQGGVLLEEFIGGDEFAVNGIADRNGDLLITDVWAYDKRESHGIPNLYYQSIKLGSHEGPFDVLGQYAADVVEALELKRSPVHMEVKIDAKGPCLIEVGARMAGGDQPVLSSKLHGRSLFELAACHYLDALPHAPQDVDYERYDRHEARIVSGIQSVEIPRISAVHGLDEIERLPSFEGFGLLKPPGMRLPVTRDLDTKSYEVYLLHPDPQQVVRDEQAVRQLLRYE